MDETYSGVRIGRRRVQPGLAAFAMGCFAAGLLLGLIYMVVGASAWYDASWFVLAIGEIALVASIGAGLMALFDEARGGETYLANEDDGQLGVLLCAATVMMVTLAIGAAHGAVVGGALGAYVALVVATIGLAGFSAQLGDALAERLEPTPSRVHITRTTEAARERERSER